MIQCQRVEDQIWLFVDIVAETEKDNQVLDVGDVDAVVDKDRILVVEDNSVHQSTKLMIPFLQREHHHEMILYQKVEQVIAFLLQGYHHSMIQCQRVEDQKLLFDDTVVDNVVEVEKDNLVFVVVVDDKDRILVLEDNFGILGQNKRSQMQVRIVVDDMMVFVVVVVVDDYGIGDTAVEIVAVGNNQDRFALVVDGNEHPGIIYCYFLIFDGMNINFC